MERRYRQAFRGDGMAVAQLFIVAISLVLVSILIFTPLTAITTYGFFARELPPPEYAMARDLSQSTMIYDRNGKLLYEVFDREEGRRTAISYQNVPEHLIQATIAAEDPTFFENPGVDYHAIARAIFQNLQRGRIVSGASTLTQQLAKNVLFDPKERQEQSISRKTKEAIYAVWLTNRFTKEEILEMYLNEVYYGHLSYGVEAAARVYFEKSVKDLTLAEAALLAGLPQAPSDYDPYIHLDMAKARQGYVLDRMVYSGFLDPDEAEKAKAEPIKLGDPLIYLRAPHAVDYAIAQLERRYGKQALYNSGWKIYLTIDSELTEKARVLAKQRIDEIRDKMQVTNSAVVIMHPATGEVLAMVGSIDYWDDKIQGKVNVADAPRQPGSTVKPFTYVTAFAQGFVPNTKIKDVRTCFETGWGLPKYCPENFSFIFHGEITLAEALASSLNVPAVKMLTHIGIGDLLETIHSLGITTMNDPDRYGLAVGLGVADVKLIDLVYTYTIFANNGKMVGNPVPLPERQTGMRELEPAVIMRIEDGRGNLVYQYEPYARQVVSPQAAFLITTVIGDDKNRHLEYQPNGPLVIDRPSAAKTGTSNRVQDTWTIGYTPDLVVGVWVGNNDGKPMKQVTSVLSAAATWHNVIKEANKHLNLPPRQFEPPAGVQYGIVCEKPGWYIQGVPPICEAG